MRHPRKLEVIGGCKPHGCKPYEPLELNRLPEGTHAVYAGASGGRFVPGGSAAELVAAHEAGTLRGAIGLWFDHHAVVGVAAATRGALASLLIHVFKDRPIFVMDELSAEWAAHYGLRDVRVGGSLWWFDGTSPGAFSVAGVAGADVRQRTKESYVTVCQTVFECFVIAKAGYPMLIRPAADGASGCASQDSYSPARRWAAAYGMLDALCNTEAEVQAKLATAHAFPRERLEQERARALDTLEELCTPPAVFSAAAQTTVFEPATEEDGALAAALAQALGGPRIVRPGDPFDPATHYDSNYYAGPDGHGIRYMQPNGTWTTYHGPAKAWDGNRVIAQTLNGLLRAAVDADDPNQPETPTLLDLGCGAGHFVSCMAALRWAARGVDISENAAQGNALVTCGDFADPAGAIEQGYWDVVTALDFWEHIWLRDLDRLIDATRELLLPKGIHFAIICTRSASEPDFVAEPGVKFTQENSWLLVSGHVNIRDWAWWARKFRQHGFRIRYDLSYLFQVKRTEDSGLALVKSWQAKNLLVLERR